MTHESTCFALDV